MQHRHYTCAIIVGDDGQEGRARSKLCASFAEKHKLKYIVEDAATGTSREEIQEWMNENVAVDQGWCVDCSENFDVSAAQHMIEGGFKPNLIIAMQAHPPPIPPLASPFVLFVGLRALSSDPACCCGRERKREREAFHSPMKKSHRIQRHRTKTFVDGQRVDLVPPCIAYP